MSEKITEDAIEGMVIELLEAEGYSYRYGPDIAPDGPDPERTSSDDVLLLGRIEAAIARLNPAVPASARLDALRQIQRLNAPDLLANNEAFHRLLTDGIPVTVQQDGNARGDLVWLVDFEHPERNEYLAVNQFTVVENGINKRPDIVLFVNGLPLVVIELKNATDENATLLSAFKQLLTYKEAIPSLFTTNGLLVISDGLEARAGSLSAGFSRFMAWKTADGRVEASPLVPQLDILLRGLLAPRTLLDLIRHFTVFERSSKEDLPTGIVTIETSKKIAAYHQYYAVNRAVESTQRAADLEDEARLLKEDPVAYGLPTVVDQPRGDRKAGVVWHTQGSGKSLSMVFYTGKIVLVLDNPTVVVITDRNDIESTDVNTPAVFGHYVDIYDIAQAVEDGGTVRIFYESRLAKIELSATGRKRIRDLDEELAQEEPTDSQQAKAKWTQWEALVGSEARLKNVAADIVGHFEARQAVFEGKGLIVAMSRRIAADLYADIVAQRPEWHSDDLDKGVIKVIMTAASSDGPAIARHHTNKQQRRALAERMKDPNDPLKLVIVRDMWLTGFDVPSLHTMYIDKPMQGHNLMQAIARVNRVYKDKPGGLIVDYLGIASDLKEALSFYSDSGGKGDPALAQEEAVGFMLEKLEVVSQLFHGFPYEEYFAADTSQKLAIILAAEDFILGLEDGRRRYINEVTALSQAFAIAVPHEEAMDVKNEVAFFQAVKARLVKFGATGAGRTDEEMETAIPKVIDIFDAAGIKKPDISILSEEFLAEIQGMEHKNVALEVLRKLLNDEIKARAKTNLVQSRSLMEMLEQSLARYHNKAITSAEVIDELIHLAKDIDEMDGEANELGLTEFEYAFYTAVASNESAQELMQQEKLRELAVVLTDRVRRNTSIDWTIKESVRAKLKVIVKRTLRQYGYPPDMQKLATDTVLKQAELIAEELTAGELENKTMQTIEQTYPNITAWLQIGWIEIGYAHAPYLDSFIRVLDEGGMIWDGEADYESLDAALAAAEAAIVEWLGVNMPASEIAIEEPPEFTAKQGQYLAFIHNYTQLHGRAPAEAELQRYFKVTPPTVHNMVVRLEENGLISSTPGQARSIQILVPAQYLPALEHP